MIRSAYEAKWMDGHGVIHMVGPHLNEGGRRNVYTECQVLIGSVQVKLDTQGFYPGDMTEGSISCIECLVRSNFGTYAPR